MRLFRNWKMEYEGYRDEVTNHPLGYDNNAYKRGREQARRDAQEGFLPKRDPLGGPFKLREDIR